MEQFTKQIEEAARQAGAELVGFSARDRFDPLEESRNPFTLFPQGRAAILVARRIPRGALRGVEEGINFMDYEMFGRSWLTTEFIAQTVNSLVRFIEGDGWEAMPLMPGAARPVDGVGRPVTSDFDWAAVACGLGEIGLSGQVLTPRFGPRQRFAMILTDAELSSSPLLAQKVCIECGRCAAACPLGALHGDDVRTVRVCGKDMRMAAREASLCAQCKNGALEGGSDRLAALCTRTCVEALQQAGTLGNSFETAFRKRPVWAKDRFGDPAQGGNV